MKKVRMLAVLLVFLLTMALLAGCAQPTQETPEPPAPTDNGEPTAEEPDGPIELDIDQISIAGAGTAGTFYIMAAGIADLINQNLGVSSVAEVTAGSVENANLLGNQEVEFAVMQLDVMQNARDGAAQFSAPIDMVAITPMYPNVIQVVTLADSPIESFSDLRGMRVSVGSPGSGILATNEMILETLGLSMDDIQPEYLSFAETTTAFRDGAVDAVIVNTAAPAPFLVDLETTHPIKAIPLTAEEIALFTDEYGYFVEATIPAGAYRTIDEDTPTFAVWITLAGHPDVPDDVVYEVVRTIFENQETLLDVHVVAEYIELDNVGLITGVPFHPGAARYYEENGITVDTE